MLALASSSARRQQLLANAGIEFVARSPDVPEVQRAGEPALAFAQRLAGEKARAVWEQLTAELPARAPEGPDSATANPLLVLGADTIVLVGDQVLGKPSDAADAARMLRLLSGRAHLVTTAVCLLGAGFEDTRVETTEVDFDVLSESEIAAYVASGEPMDKAGAYAIQGIASRWICRLVGCYFNVVGLPVPLVYRMLREHSWGQVGQPR